MCLSAYVSFKLTAFRKITYMYIYSPNFKWYTKNEERCLNPLDLSHFLCKAPGSSEK